MIKCKTYNMHIVVEIYKGKDDEKHLAEKHEFDVKTPYDLQGFIKQIENIVCKYESEKGFYHNGYIFCAFGIISGNHKMLFGEHDWLVFKNGINKKSKLLWFENRLNIFVNRFVNLAMNGMKVDNDED